jgi:hypothetical protein
MAAPSRSAERRNENAAGRLAFACLDTRGAEGVSFQRGRASPDPILEESTTMNARLTLYASVAVLALGTGGMAMAQTTMQSPAAHPANPTTSTGSQGTGNAGASSGGNSAAGGASATGGGGGGATSGANDSTSGTGAGGAGAGGGGGGGAGGGGGSNGGGAGH